MATPNGGPHPSSVPKFPELEEAVLARWRRDNIFQQTLEQTKNGRPFIFFEGPPTANGKPGIHHVLARAFKDVIPRFKTMQGYFVERKAGWDTHGLPVELAVEKQLGLKSKKEIEEYGIEKFNAACRASVWEYKSEWEKLTERIGFWLDLEHPYVTYETSYVESLWSIIKKVWDRGLLYQGHKVVPHCPRCGTSLSSHEVAQGYKSVTDASVYLKFRVTKGKGSVQKGDYILSWTTTPWTLPGNVALAVGENIDYVRTKANEQGESYILASARVASVFGEIEKAELIKGADLVGIEYEPLFSGAIPSSTPNFENAFKVYPADFVTTEDGTGVVHTAVMYGEDDYKLGEAVGLPKVHTVNEDGTFNDLVAQWKGWPVKHKDKPTEEKTTKAIIEDLKSRNLLLKEEAYTHDYPFCWRCDSPLLYYAKTSWFIKMSALREELKKRNDTVNWIPEHIKDGRFGGWIDEVKDWAFSRERYWGTPLPMWECSSCKERHVVGSLADLEQHAPAPTRFLFLRHAEAQTTVDEVWSSFPEPTPSPLTEKGKSEAAAAAALLKKEKIDLIISSPLQRTQETAGIVASALGLTVEQDDRVQEIRVGKRNGTPYVSYLAAFPNRADRFTKSIDEGETLNDVKRRMVAFVRDMRARHPGKTILVVTHGDPIWMVESAIGQLSDEDTLKNTYPVTGAFRELTVRNLPYGELGVVDLHRPYIDDVRLNCPKCSQEMRRIKDLCDVWFDSGAMPYAQWHYPMENTERVDGGKNFPADYIAEAMDQTRGWFYTLLAVATLLEKDAPFKNVICLAHILDTKGQKMSKSRGNVVDPWSVINEYGADPLRFHLFTMNQPGEYKLFDPKQVGDVNRKMFMILWNVISFWELYPDVAGVAPRPPQNRHLLDQWILQRLAGVIDDVTAGLESYDVTASGRALQNFVTDLSTWYVRRSRARFKAGGAEQADARATLGTCLTTIAHLLAPFTPMLADALYEKVGGSKASVHLESWPAADAVWPAKQRDAIDAMATTRSLVEIGHALREEAGIRVRQPLGQFVVAGTALPDAYVAILRDELNVRDVVITQTPPNGMDWKTKVVGTVTAALDTTISDELMAEGWFREMVRFVNDLRKKAKFTIADHIVIHASTDDETLQKVLAFYDEQLKKETRAQSIVVGDAGAEGSELTLGKARLRITIAQHS